MIAQVLGLDYKKDEEVALGNQLVEVGLAEWMPYQHLRLHPALAPMLWREMDEEEQQEARGIWVEAMMQLVGFLYQQKFKDAQLAAVLTLLELPNLLAALEVLARPLGTEAAEAERVVGVATGLEGLLQNLGRPKALARVVEIREKAAQELGEWSHSQYLQESAGIDRLLDAGRVAEAVSKAEALLQKARGSCSVEGEAYAGASYDLAIACFKLGRALQMGGGAASALESLREARQRFGKLGEAGDMDAERMASACLAEIGDCLSDLGRLDEAAVAYEENIESAKKLEDPRQVATSKFQLGTLRIYQRRYGDALEALNEAREVFEQLGEPGSVAGAWQQIGMVREEAGQFDAAEHAYQQSLAITVRRGDPPGEARTLNQLGNLYSSMGRLEDAVRFYRDAVTIYGELGDLKNEGFGRNNLAGSLINLQRYDEAREEILRAIECGEPFSYVAEPWKTFDILRTLETALENSDAAAEARRRSIEAFLAYRRDGGGAHGMATQLAASVGKAIADGEVDAVAAQLEQFRERSSEGHRYFSALKAILEGSRDPVLALDPGLHYEAAVELRLLLESLGVEVG